MEISSCSCGQNTNFNGLSKQLSKAVYNSDEVVNCLISSFPKSKGFVGNIPSEFIEHIKKTKKSGDVAGSINKIKDVFSNISCGLRKQLYNNEYNMNKATFENLSFDDFLFAQSKSDQSSMLRALFDVRVKNRYSDLISDKQLKAFSAELTKGLKHNNSLEGLKKVDLEYLGSGSFGHAFKMSFLDKKNKKLLHDKVLKVYRNPEERKFSYRYAFDAMKEYVNNTKVEDYIKRIDSIKAKKHLEYLKLEDLNKNFEFIKNSDISDFSYLSRTFNNSDVHGVGAEANAALFIKRNVGRNLSSSNLIEPYCFDLKNNYAIMDMADKELKTVKRVELPNLGITCYDDHNGNYVNGKLIDYGGIKVTNTKLMRHPELRDSIVIRNKEDAPQKKYKSLTSLFSSVL